MANQMFSPISRSHFSSRSSLKLVTSISIDTGRLYMQISQYLLPHLRLTRFLDMYRLVKALYAATTFFAIFTLYDSLTFLLGSRYA